MSKTLAEHIYIYGGAPGGAYQKKHPQNVYIYTAEGPAEPPFHIISLITHASLHVNTLESIWTCKQIVETYRKSIGKRSTIIQK